MDLISLQAVWALGNIAGDSPKCRDFVLGHNALPSLLEQMKEDSKISMLRNATWTLSNFCRGKPSPSFVTVSWYQTCTCDFKELLIKVAHQPDITVECPAVKVPRRVWRLGQQLCFQSMFGLSFNHLNCDVLC